MRPEIVQITPSIRVICNAPPGHCPWGEAMCDDQCQPYDGCLLHRDAERVTA